MRKPTLRKYPDGGKSGKTATPPPVNYNLDDFNSILGKYDQIDVKKVPSEVSGYMSKFVTPNLLGYQDKLNTALRSKYNLAPNAPITNQYLSPEEGDKALGGKYQDYMNNFNAYQTYRQKASGLPARSVAGTYDYKDDNVYGERHVNLLHSYNQGQGRGYTTNTVKPTFAKGGTNDSPYNQGYEQNISVAGNQNSPMTDPSQMPTQSQMDYAQRQQKLNSTDQSLNSEVSQGASMLSGTSGALGSVSSGLGWLGAATAAEGVGKSLISKDKAGNPTTNLGQAENEILTPDHEQMLNDVQKGNWGTALIDSTGMGKFGRMVSELTGNGKKTTGTWGSINKFLGTPQYSHGGTKKHHWSDFPLPSGMYPNGGMNGTPNAEVEKEEVMRMPDGDTQQVDGPSHENGGVPVNIPQGTQIFSDRLKLPGSKETIADQASKFKTNREEKVLADNSSTKIAKATANLTADIKQRKLDQLFQAQEALKQSKVAAYARKMGVELPTDNESREPQGQSEQSEGEYASGGIHIKPSHRGRFTAYKERTGETTAQALHSSSPHVRQMANFARNAAKWHHAYGGIQQYPDGGLTPMDMPEDPSLDMNLMNRKAPINPLTGEPHTDWSQYIGPVANGLVQSAGNIYELAKSGMGNKYTREDYGRVNPVLLDNAQALNDADVQNRITRGDINNASGGNAGSYLSNVQIAQGQNTMNKARIREQYQNANAGIQNSFAQYNKGLQMQGLSDTEANKARSEDIAANALNGIGSNIAGAYKDIKGNEMDDKKLALINQYFPNYKMDPKTFQMYYQAAVSAGSRPKGKPRTKSMPNSGIGYTQ